MFQFNNCMSKHLLINSNMLNVVNKNESQTNIEDEIKVKMRLMSESKRTCMDGKKIR